MDSFPTWSKTNSTTSCSCLIYISYFITNDYNTGATVSSMTTTATASATSTTRGFCCSYTCFCIRRSIRASTTSTDACRTWSSWIINSTTSTTCKPLTLPWSWIYCTNTSCICCWSSNYYLNTSTTSTASCTIWVFPPAPPPTTTSR